jgi:uncharacterized protein (DUF362 family)
LVNSVTAQYSTLREIDHDSNIWKDFPEVKGKKVFIKPNLVMPESPWNRACCTRVEVVSLLIEHLLYLGVTPDNIIVGDCGFKNQWPSTLISTGYDSLLSYGVNIVCVQEGENYHKYTLCRYPETEGAYLSLYGTKISNFLLESDVVINVPKMKEHKMAGFTGAIKNMMGVIAPKGAMHPNGSSVILHKRLRDLYVIMKDRVQWVLMDGIEVSRYAECYGVPEFLGCLVSGVDMGEVDFYSANQMGISFQDIPYFNYIHQYGNKNKGQGLL